MSDFIQFASERGLIIDRIDQGRWIRCATTDKPKKKNGGFFHGGDFASVINWATMTDHETWFPNKPRTPFEQQDMQKRMEASRKQYAQERAGRQQEAAKKAEWILSQCELGKHAYLDRKGFPDMCANVWRKPDADPLLVVPMYHGEQIAGCQLIGIDGSKKFLTGQRCNDARFSIGQGGDVFLCEGYASALSLHAILNTFKKLHTIHATFSAGNMARFAKRWPQAILICDNDASGTGQKVGRESERPFYLPEKEGDDINDEHVKYGLFKCRERLRKFLMQNRSEG